LEPVVRASAFARDSDHRGDRFRGGQWDGIRVSPFLEDTDFVLHSDRFRRMLHQHDLRVARLLLGYFLLHGHTVWVYQVSIGHFLTRLPPRWKELARPFQISAIMGALAGAYSAYSVLPRVIIERALFYSGVSSGDGFSGIFASVLIAIVFLVLFAIPLGGAIALVTLRMSDE